MKKILLSSSIVLAFAGYSQINGELDQTFNPALTTTGSIIVQDDGKILLGGGPNRLNTDGSLDATYAQLNTATKVLIKDGLGVYGFGYGASHYNSNGNPDTPTNQVTSSYGLGGTSYFGRAQSAVKLPNGDIFVVGEFDYVYHGSGPAPLNNIVVYTANLNINGAVSNNIGTGFNAEALCVDVDTINEKVYVVGKFTSYNGNSANGICRLNYDGTFDNTFNSGTGFPITSSIFPDFVRVMSDGRVLVSAGQYAFTSTYNGTSFSYSIMLNSDGSQNTTFQPTGFGNVYDLEELSDNRMIIAGHNGTLGDISIVNSLTGALLGGSASFPSGFGTNNNMSDTYINNITKVEEGVYLLGGNFESFSGEAKTNLVKVTICDRYVDPSSLIVFNNNQLSSTVTGTSYLWIGEDLDENSITIPDNTNQTITPTVPGYYRLTVTDEPCVFTSSYFNLSSLTVNEKEDVSFNIYPNPAKEQVTISNIEAGSTVVLLDVTGKIVSQVVSSTTTVNIETSNFTPGVYFVAVPSLNGTQKLVIE
jgi:hypothetical protein